MRATFSTGSSTRCSSGLPGETLVLGTPFIIIMHMGEVSVRMPACRRSACNCLQGVTRHMESRNGFQNFAEGEAPWRQCLRP